MAIRDFQERMAHLSDEVGHGKLVGRVECDQVYAKYQHERTDLKHPNGGTHHYLSGPLFENVHKYMSDLAASVVVSVGSELPYQMERTMEDLAWKAQKRAPIEWGDLANSMHPSVTSRGQVIYDRPPYQRRLSSEELREKHRWRP